jgi:hypothetical protein
MTNQQNIFFKSIFSRSFFAHHFFWIVLFFFSFFAQAQSFTVIRYDKANINLEKEATISNNSSQTAQPTTLEICTGLNYE